MRRAISSVVPVASPVTIFTCMPASKHRCTAAGTSSRTGSVMAQSPVNVSPPVSASAWQSSPSACDTVLLAKASVRMAEAWKRSSRVFTDARLASSITQRASTTSGAPFTWSTRSPETCDSTSVAIYLRSVENESWLIKGTAERMGRYSCPMRRRCRSRAHSVGLPMPISSGACSMWAVALTAMFSMSSGSSAASCCSSATVMRFCVSVPVLSVHTTVMAPIVSQACIRRTRLFVLSMRRMLSARLSVTAMGKPSGTAMTMSVTASMKFFNTIWATPRVRFSVASW